MWIAPAPADIVEKIPDARQVVAIRTSSEKRRPEAKERDTQMHYYVITGKPGMRRLTPERALRLIRQHWGIENRLHHRLDRTLLEDAQRTRVGDGASVLSLLRKAALVVLDVFMPKGPACKTLPEKRAKLKSNTKKAVSLLKKRHQ